MCHHEDPGPGDGDDYDDHGADREQPGEPGWHSAQAEAGIKTQAETNS